jgi:hypothetical protein
LRCGPASTNRADQASTSCSARQTLSQLTPNSPRTNSTIRLLFLHGRSRAGCRCRTGSSTGHRGEAVVRALRPARRDLRDRTCECDLSLDALSEPLDDCAHVERRPLEVIERHDAVPEKPER